MPCWSTTPPHPEAVEPASARNEVLSFIRSGLTDLSISRSTFDWGIKVPWDPEQVVYVWFDALLNYATAVGLGDPEGSEGGAKFASTFPADVHLVGKDILRFHAVIWPAMLMAAGLPLPGKVFAHGWLLVGGEKMSKSKLTAIAPSQITDHFGVDAFRWYFLRAIQFGQDGSFSWEDMSARYTSELANGLGNLASRVTAMTGRYFDGALPAAQEPTAAEEAVADAAAAAVAPRTNASWLSTSPRAFGHRRLRERPQRLPDGAGAVEGRQRHRLRPGGTCPGRHRPRDLGRWPARRRRAAQRDDAVDCGEDVGHARR